MPVSNPKVANNVLGQINSTAAAPTVTWGGDVIQSSGTGIYGSASEVKACIAGSDIVTVDANGMRTSGALGVGNSAAATTPGTVVKKIEIFNAAGVSLGFIAVYDAIV